MELVARHAAEPPPVGLELVFTRRRGGRAARGQGASTSRQLRSPYGFVLDHATPIGEVIVAAPHLQAARGDFNGTEAHAGINPEDGAQRDRGRGGRDRRDEARPARRGDDRERRRDRGRHRLQRRRRPLPRSRPRRAASTGERAAEPAGEMVDACTWAAGEHGCDVDLEVSEMFRGYRMADDSPPGGDRRGGPRARAATSRQPGRHRRRQRRQRAAGPGLRRGAARQRNRRRTTRPRRGSPAAADGDARGLRGDPREVGGPDGQVLKLRRGTVVSDRPADGSVDGRSAAAWADEGMVGEVRERRRGDRQHRGARPRARLGRLRHRPRQPDPRPGGRRRCRRARDEAQLHLAPAPGRAGRGADDERGWWRHPTRRSPVLVLLLHGQLAPAAWAAAGAAHGELRGSATSRRRAARCRGRSRATWPSSASRGLLCGHVTAGPCLRRRARGDQRRRRRCTPPRTSSGWDAAIAGAGPGILGSATRYGHGGMAALDTAHAALALGLPTVVAPRMSAADARSRHRGRQPSHARQCSLLLAPVPVPAPDGVAESAARRWSARSGKAGWTPRHRERARRTSTATRRAGCRREPWAAASPRTPLSSPPRSRPDDRARRAGE